jgi:uncharacterized membrane protein YvbJ
MALIQCPECKSKVSSIAKSCPHCGAPISDTADYYEKGRTTTVQLTSKKLKSQGCLSYFIIAFGFLLVMISSKARQGGDESLSKIGFYILLAGGIWLAITKIRIWWHHE